MELNILFRHSITTVAGAVESVVCAEFDSRLYTIIKHDEHAIVPEKKPRKYRYESNGYYAASDMDIDIVEALKAAIGLPNTCTNIDPWFYFDHA